MKEALRITIIYIFVASLWIFFSDTALAMLNLDVETLVRLSQFKGFAYVLVTGLMLFFLVRKEIYQKNEVIGELKQTIDLKDSVMRELHHRIKNNLQNVISIINLETGEQGLTEIAKDRILDKLYALSAIHDLVYTFANYRQIPLQPVLEHFFSYRHIPVAEENLDIQDTVQYPLEKIVPLLLGINELFEELSSQLGHYQFWISSQGKEEIDITIQSENLFGFNIDRPSISLYLTGSGATVSSTTEGDSVTLRFIFS